MTTICHPVEKVLPSPRRCLLIPGVHFRWGNIEIATSTVEPGLREEHPCSLINYLEVIWCCSVVVRVRSKKSRLQAILVLRVEPVPELLISVVHCELTLVEEGPCDGEKPAVIFGHVTGITHVVPCCLVNKLPELLFSVPLYRSVIWIQDKQFPLEGVPSRCVKTLLKTPEITEF